MLPRLILGGILLMLIVVVLNVLLIGHDDRRPMGSVRRTLVRNAYKFLVRMIGLFTLWTWHTYENVENVDYSEYLGTSEVQPV